MNAFLDNIKQRISSLPTGKERDALVRELKFIDVANEKTKQLETYEALKYELGNKKNTSAIVQNLLSFFSLREKLGITDTMPEGFSQFVVTLLEKDTPNSVELAGKIISRAGCYSNPFASICKLKNIEDAKYIYNLWAEKTTGYESAPRLFSSHHSKITIVPIQFLNFILPTTTHWDIPCICEGIGGHLIRNPQDIQYIDSVAAFEAKYDNSENSHEPMLQLIKDSILSELGDSVPIPQSILTFALEGKKAQRYMHTLLENSFESLIENVDSFDYSSFLTLCMSGIDLLDVRIAKILPTFALVNSDLDDLIQKLAGKEYSHILAYGLPNILLAFQHSKDYREKAKNNILKFLDIIEGVPTSQLSELLNATNIKDRVQVSNIVNTLSNSDILRICKLPWARNSQLKRRINISALHSGNAELVKVLKPSIAQVYKATYEAFMSEEVIAQICKAYSNPIKVKARQLCHLANYPFDKELVARLIQTLLDNKEVRDYAAMHFDFVDIALNKKIDISKYNFPKYLIKEEFAFSELLPQMVEFLWRHGIRFNKVGKCATNALAYQFKHGRHKTALAMLKKGLRLNAEEFEGALCSALKYSKNEELIIELVNTHPKANNLKLTASKGHREVSIVEFAIEDYGPGLVLALSLAGYHDPTTPIAGRYITQGLNSHQLELAVKAGISPLIGGNKSALFSPNITNERKTEIFEIYIQRMCQADTRQEVETTLYTEIVLG